MPRGFAQELSEETSLALAACVLWSTVADCLWSTVASRLRLRVPSALLWVAAVLARLRRALVVIVRSSASTVSPCACLFLFL
jgi:hypothetical protein